MAIPRHLAIIMDGNGRWATAQGLMEGLTLYSFSTENWSREQAEVDFLMALYVEYIKAQRPQLMDNNIRFKQIGRRAGLPQEVLDELDRSKPGDQLRQPGRDHRRGALDRREGCRRRAGARGDRARPH